MYLRPLLIVTGLHLIKCAAEYVYFTECTGLWKSVFAHGSPMCRGLHWVADSAMTNLVSLVGGYGAKMLTTL